jgi:hypothetical protein
LLQKLTAGFFLALLLFVYAAKATHQHQPVPSFSKGISDCAEVSQSSECSICAYQLTQDSFHFNGFYEVIKPEQTRSFYSYYNTPFLTSIGSASSGRGPPAFS